MKIGRPAGHRDREMGSQISGQQMERILDYIRSGVEEGARLLLRRRARHRRR